MTKEYRKKDDSKIKENESCNNQTKFGSTCINNNLVNPNTYHNHYYYYEINILQQFSKPLLLPLLLLLQLLHPSSFYYSP